MRIRTHPGEVLREEFVVPLGVSARKIAELVNVPANRISEIMAERREITADTALRLAALFGTSPEFWTNLQAAHDLSKKKAQSARAYLAIKTITSAAVTPPKGARNRQASGDRS